MATLESTAADIPIEVSHAAALLGYEGPTNVELPAAQEPLFRQALVRHVHWSDEQCDLCRPGVTGGE